VAGGGVAGARAALLAWVDAAGEGGRTFLEARLLRTGEGRYEIRNARDRRRSLASLESVTSDPYAARAIGQVSNTGAYRPLRTAPGLRQGWALVELDAAALWTALDVLYPACALHWWAGERGRLRATHWRETALRQSGIYGAVRLLPDEVVRDTVRACCGDAVCLRRVAWRIDGETPLELPSGGGPVGEAAVPCPEACSMFVSFARQVLVLERSPREELSGLGRVGREEVEQLRAIALGAASGTLGGAREGAFGEPTNPRRMRYLALRLAAERERLGEPPAPELPCEGCPRPVPCRGCPLT
jgi:hypothetical protein